MNDTAHFLSRDCFVCNTGMYWIILSASRDKYLCVAHEELASIGHRISGWEDKSNSLNHCSSTEAEAGKLIKSLTAHGILTSDPMLGKPFTESKYAAPDSQIEPSEINAPANASFPWIARCLMACTKADWRLRTNPFSRTLTTIERRRSRAECSAATYDTAYVSTLVMAFKALRPLYPRPYLCLFDSLALLEFLAEYHFFPHIVFGVVADPFEAHCWVQEGTTIINDDLERVGKYKPILSV